jgi:hypothetical protein
MLLTADRLIPLRVGIISSTTIVSYSSGTTTYICGTVRSGSEEKALTTQEGDQLAQIFTVWSR